MVQRASRQIRRDNRRLALVDLLGGSCVGCGTLDGLEFDHVLPEDKTFTIGGGAIEYGLEKVLPELQKCQLLCRPCHTQKTILDRGFNEVLHGRPSTYSNKKCRCRPCTDAWSTYVRVYVDKYNNSDIDRRRKQRRESSARYYDNARSLKSANLV